VDSGFAACRNLNRFAIKEELLCEAQSCIGTSGLRAAAGSAPTSGHPAECRRVKILTFQLTAHIELLKEGGRAKRIENSELKVMVYPNIPFSVFCLLYFVFCFGVAKT